MMSEVVHIFLNRHTLEPLVCQWTSVQLIFLMASKTPSLDETEKRGVAKTNRKKCLPLGPFVWPLPNQ